MTEQQKALAFVIHNFMTKAEKLMDDRKAPPDKVLTVERYYFSAIEVAGMGAATSTIDQSVTRLTLKIRIPFLDFNYMQYAIAMAKNGASKDIIEMLIRLLLKYKYTWIWALEELTTMADRVPTREEIITLVKLERKNMGSMSSDMHEKYIQFAKNYLSKKDIDEIITILDAKVTEWNNQLD